MPKSDKKSMTTETLQEQIAETSGWIQAVKDEMAQVLVGQERLVDRLLIGLLCNGHILLEGVPGLAKTLAVKALSGSLHATFARFQFTPDLLPADLVGTMVYHPQETKFEPKLGPIFNNLILADEINRAPAKTQAALLEVMQEQQVTIDGETLRLSPPFMTLATQNPVEHEGTYPLPEAQLDRFIMKVLIDYPARDAECAIVTRAAAETPGGWDSGVAVICGPLEIVAAQQATAAVQVVPEVVGYAVALAQATRESRSISLGAGTRGTISLVRIGKAFAALDGRDFVTPDDIKRAALPVLRHRVQLTPEIAISGLDVDEVLQAIVESVPAPRQ